MIKSNENSVGRGFKPKKRRHDSWVWPQISHTPENFLSNYYQKTKMIASYKNRENQHSIYLKIKKIVSRGKRMLNKHKKR